MDGQILKAYAQILNEILLNSIFMKGGENIMEIVNNNIDIKEDAISSQGKWKKTHLSNCDISTTDILKNSVKNNFGASL